MIGIICLVFLMPLAQRNFHIWTFKSLKGEHYPHHKPSVTLQSWLDGSFQSAADKYCTDSFGFQEPLVRTINQLEFTLFHEANAQYVVVGKDNYLYETPYIEAHLGMDYLGDSIIFEKTRKLKAIQDTLRQLGVNLDVIFAPGKASYYPEFIPDYYWQYRNVSTNYDALKTSFQQSNIPFLDFHAWFRSEKNLATAPLFPQTGIHWSQYGMMLASDSILKFWNQRYGETLPTMLIHLPDTTTTITQGSDADVEDGLNILQTLPHKQMLYPKAEFLERNKKIRTAVIADSYYWGLFDLGLSTVACDSAEFWYYFKQVYPQHFTQPLMIQDLDLKEAIESKETILLLQTDATLDRFGFGFIEAVYDLYFEK